ncbi:hypothetical protein [Pseudomonas monsensis]
MDWKQFFAAIVTATAWPSAIVIVVLTLRAPLAKLIPMMRSLKYKDLQIDLSEKLEAVKVELEAQPTLDKPPLPYVPIPGVLELARIDPRASIISAWIEVERATIEMATKAGLALAGPVIAIANELHARDYLSEFEFKTFRSLRQVRNDAVHLSTKDVTYDEAFAMAETCQWLAHRIRMLIEGLPSSEQKPRPA